MTRHRAPVLGLAAVLLATTGGPSGSLDAQEDPAAAAKETALAAGGPVAAAVLKTADEFKRAFDAGDAKAVAALWTVGGEMIEPDGTQLVGRGTIEDAYADFFKENPKAAIDVTVESVRVLGPNVAIESGTSKVARRDGAVSTGRYSALHVRDADGWKIASVTEFTAAGRPTLKDIEWLVGEWEAGTGGRSATVTYAWDEKKAFLRGRYEVKDAGEVVASGAEVIGRDPAGGLRSWRFDDGGAFAESSWVREEKSWLIETTGRLTDGSEAGSLVILTPLDDDSFLWQSTARSVGGETLPSTAPLKVKRVGKAAGASRADPGR